MRAQPKRWLLVFLFSSTVVAADTPAIDTALAERYFREAQGLWKADGGKLWGRSLAGPLIFADPATRRIVASQADAEGRLQRASNVFVGELPPNVGAANTSIRWAGVEWVMVLWPLPKADDARRVLMMHESWHRVQSDLGLPSAGPANVHLDTLDGRYWLQLEWRALAAALTQSGAERKTAIADALIFRGFRRSLFQKSAAEERLLEMHEGLAEYTGVKLAGMSEAEQRAYVIRKLDERPAAMPTFVRSFAYLSGPAYGLLLDAAMPDWRRGLKPEIDFGTLVQRGYGVDSPPAIRAHAESRALNYGGQKLRDHEEQRDAERRRRSAELRARLVEGPVLILPLIKMQMSFNPNTVQPLEGVGTAYPTIKLSDDWGTLNATHGALISSDFQRAHVSAPNDPQARPIRGDGWELQLAEGWRIEPAERKGDWRVIRKK